MRACSEVTSANTLAHTVTHCTVPSLSGGAAESSLCSCQGCATSRRACRVDSPCAGTCPCPCRPLCGSASGAASTRTRCAQTGTRPRACTCESANTGTSLRQSQLAASYDSGQAFKVSGSAAGPFSSTRSACTAREDGCRHPIHAGTLHGLCEWWESCATGEQRSSPVKKAQQHAARESEGHQRSLDREIIYSTSFPAT